MVFVFSWYRSTWTCNWTMETNGVAREWSVNWFQVLGEPSVYLYQHIIIISGKNSTAECFCSMLAGVEDIRPWKIYSSLQRDIRYVCLCVYIFKYPAEFFRTMLNIILTLAYIRTTVSLEDTWKSCYICMYPHTHTHTHTPHIHVHVCMHTFEIYIHTNTLVTHTQTMCL